MFKIALGLLFLTPVVLKCQTCIISIRMRDEMLIGSDSRIFVWGDTVIRGKRIQTHSFDTVCKIHHVGDKFFCITGLYEESIIKSAIKACFISNKIEGTAIYFRDIVKPALKSYINYYKKRYPLSYKKALKKLMENQVQVLFYDFENYAPKIMIVKLKIIKFGKEDRIDVIDSLDYSHMADIQDNHHTDFIASGDTSAIVKWFNKIDYNVVGFQEYIIELIKKQHESTPDEVAEPIDIISIKNNNVTNWIYNGIGSRCAIK